MNRVVSDDDTFRLSTKVVEHNTNNIFVTLSIAITVMTVVRVCTCANMMIRNVLAIIDLSMAYVTRT